MATNDNKNIEGEEDGSIEVSVMEMEIYTRKQDQLRNDRINSVNIDITHHLSVDNRRRVVKRVRELGNKYRDLTWYARNTTKRATKPRHYIRETYPEKAAKLSDPMLGDWEHGFNSGCLAMVELMSAYLGNDIEMEDDEYPTREDLIRDAEKKFRIWNS